MEEEFSCKTIIENIQNEIKLSTKGCIIRPSLALIEIGTNEINDMQVKKLEEDCNKVGIYFRHFVFEDDTPELTVINKIKELNNDDYVNGVIVKLPFSEKYNDKRIINSIVNTKDVCGLTDINVGRFISGRKTIVSPSVLAVQEILKEKKLDVEGKVVTVVGKGRRVGRPLVNAMINMGATVISCNSKTTNLEKYLKESNIIISSAGSKSLINKDMLDENQEVYDMGYTVVNGKIFGDVDLKSIKGMNINLIGNEEGIWNLVNAMIIRNLLLCYNNKKNNNQK